MRKLWSHFICRSKSILNTFAQNLRRRWFKGEENCTVIKKQFKLKSWFSFFSHFRFHPIIFLCRWFFRNKQGRNESIEHMIMTGRYKIKESRLLIQSIEQSDNTIFYCTATNEQGSETLEIQLKVVAPLQVHIQPNRQTVDVGKSADLVRHLLFLIRFDVSTYSHFSFFSLLRHSEMHDKWNAAVANLVAKRRAATPDGFKGSSAEQGSHQNHISVKGRSRDVPMFREEWCWHRRGHRRNQFGRGRATTPLSIHRADPPAGPGRVTEMHGDRQPNAANYMDAWWVSIA